MKAVKKKPVPKKITNKRRPGKPGCPWIAEGLRPLAEPLEKLTIDPANARAHDDANIKAIAGSLKRFGQRVVLVANCKNGQIEKGNGTYLAAKQLGWSHLAVLWVEDDPASQVGFSVADNRTSEMATWDDTLLQKALLEIEGGEPDLYADLLLRDLRQDAADEQQTTDGDGQPVPDSFQVIVDCAHEADQKAFYERLQREGRTCRLLTL